VPSPSFSHSIGFPLSFSFHLPSAFHNVLRCVRRPHPYRRCASTSQRYPIYPYSHNRSRDDLRARVLSLPLKSKLPIVLKSKQACEELPSPWIPESPNPSSNPNPKLHSVWCAACLIDSVWSPWFPAKGKHNKSENIERQKDATQIFSGIFWIVFNANDSRRNLA